MFCDSKCHIFGQLLSPEVVEWIDAALELRISPRGNDGAEAVVDLVELIRNFSTERAKSIIFHRRQKTVFAEMKRDRQAKEMERRRKARVKAIVEGRPLASGYFTRLEQRQTESS